MACRVPPVFLDSLDPLEHGDLGVFLGLMEIQASQDFLEPKDRKGTQGSHQERPMMGQRVMRDYPDSLGIQDHLEERGLRVILDLQATLENRGSRDLRAAQGPKVTLAGRAYLDL